MMAVRKVDQNFSPTYTSPANFFDSDYVDGQCSIFYNEVPIDLLLDNRGFQRTVVYFHAALGQIPEIPLFLGQNISSQLDANAIFVSDPSLTVSTDLKLSWYAGNVFQTDLPEVLSSILRHILNCWGQQQPPIFFGSSGGGFASLLYSSFFHESTAVAVNPQTIIRNYIRREVRQYCKFAWKIDDEEYDPMSLLPAHMDLRNIYRLPVTNRAFYIQNSGDVNHTINHQAPFYESLHSKSQLVDFTNYWKDGHKPPPKDFLLSVLKEAIRAQ